MEQRSEEWFAARRGIITASRMSDVMAFSESGFIKSGPNKGKAKDVRPLKARTDYAKELAAERITGTTRASVRARALEWGREREPEARALYEAVLGVLVEECGFITHKRYPYIGASPDFLVLREGGGEIKCPESIDVHMSTIIDGLPTEHIEQIQGGLFVTGRQWWDFVSYHPDFPEPLRLYIQRVTRDDEYISRLFVACQTLEEEVTQIMADVQSKAQANRMHVASITKAAK